MAIFASSPTSPASSTSPASPASPPAYPQSAPPAPGTGTYPKSMKINSSSTIFGQQIKTSKIIFSGLGQASLASPVFVVGELPRVRNATKTNEIFTICSFERPDFEENVNISKVLQYFFELRFPLEIRLANPSEERRITACQEYC